VTGGLAAFDDFASRLELRGEQPVVRSRVTTIQVNVGLRCNLACHHCHVESGPRRSERLSARDCQRVLELLERNPQVEVLDLTGGAPELHDCFRDLVRGARALGRRVIDRCNLTVLLEAGQQDTAEFLAEHAVHIIASLPCYTRENVERQRGRGIFDDSIRALRRLNELGYARDHTAGRLELVYNPVGAFLPPEQATLELEYRERLREDFGIEFDGLLTITNMPIKRFAHQLEREDRLAEYMSLLVNHFNPDTLPALMCRSLLSVDHRGRLYDCDFNLALGLDPPWGPASLWDVDDLDAVSGAPISTAAHCFGCTAGAGSSCGGALAPMTGR
jgi:radical SAM/Cys-rich protein